MPTKSGKPSKTKRIEAAIRRSGGARNPRAAAAATRRKSIMKRTGKSRSAASKQMARASARSRKR